MVQAILSHHLALEHTFILTCSCEFGFYSDPLPVGMLYVNYLSFHSTVLTAVHIVVVLNYNFSTIGW